MNIKTPKKSPLKTTNKATALKPAASSKTSKVEAGTSSSAILKTPYNAPKIEGVLGNGEHVTFSKFAGKWLVLYFYPKDLTSGCTLEARDFQATLGHFEKLHCAVVGVSKDSCQSHAKFAQKEDLSFDLIADTEGKLCENFGVWKEKSMYGRTYMGIERSTFLVSPNGEIVAQWRNVKVKGHVEEVLATLKKIQLH